MLGQFSIRDVGESASGWQSAMSASMSIGTVLS